MAFVATKWGVVLDDVVDGLADFTLAVLFGVKAIELLFVADVV